MTPAEIGRLIKWRRDERGMTQLELAKAVGVSASAIGMYEKGLRRPKDNVVEALADVFNVPKWSILYDENEVVPKEKVDDPDDWICLAPGFYDLPIDKQREFKSILSGAWDAMCKSVGTNNQRKD